MNKERIAMEALQLQIQNKEEGMKINSCNKF